MVFITIIIPTYNNINLLFKAINSIINQSFTNWELIIIDDASKDNTLIKIKKFIKQQNLNHKIHIFRNKKNKGCYVNMKIGIKK